MPTGTRLSALDASFLHLEKAGTRMHVASVTIFDEPTPAYDELREHVESRLHLVPRFRQRLAEVPLDLGRPVWVDDPHFNLRYHLRHAGLPSPGSDEQLKNLAGRLFAQSLDKTKPLWEMWLVTNLSNDGFALIAKSHQSLVDCVSAVDITTVLFDTEPDAPRETGRRRKWVARPLPSKAQLLSDALLERATRPAELERSARALVRTPRRFLRDARDGLQAMGALGFAGLRPAPPTPLNVKVGPHRRYTWVDAKLAELHAIKSSLGGTVNDAVLTSVSGALGRFLRMRGVDTDGLLLRALVPISIRADSDQGALGNRVAPRWVSLPVGIEDPAAQYAHIREETAELWNGHPGVAARTLTELADFAAPTIMSQAARLQQSQRAFNLVITNIPGPQFPLYLMGRRLQALYPVVPLTGNHALGIAVLSYNGQLGFGLVADYDALSDLDELAVALRESIDALVAGASDYGRRARRRRKVQDSSSPPTAGGAGSG